jgi:hypothetical protein
VGSGVALLTQRQQQQRRHALALAHATPPRGAAHHRGRHLLAALLDQHECCFDEVAHDLVDVAPVVAHLCELGGLDLCACVCVCV